MEEDEGIGNVAAGYHFRPNPRELVKFYLRPRLLNEPLPNQAIKELNLYDFHPRDILGNTPAGKHLYFFTPRKKKYPNGTRPARGANGGYWKASGKDRIIRDKHGKEIGRRKSLVFHEGHQRNGTRTKWLMQEYTIREFWLPTDRNKDELGAVALCEIYRKPPSNQSRDGEFQVDEQEAEEEGPASHFSGNIFVDRLVQPRPPPCIHGSDRGKAPIASTGFGNANGLLPQASYGPSGNKVHTMSSVQSDILVHSSYCSCAVPTSSSLRSGSSSISSFRNQLMQQLPQNIPHGEILSSELDVVDASFSQYRSPSQCISLPQFYFEGSQPMPSTYETSLEILSSQNMPHGGMLSSEFGIAASSSFQHQLPPQDISSLQFDFEVSQPMPSSFETSPQILSSQNMSYGMMSSSEFDVAAALSFQYQLPLECMPPSQFYFEASQLLPSTSQTSLQTTLWPLPNQLS